MDRKMVLTRLCADTGQGAHQGGLDAVDGVVINVGAVCPLLLHGGGDTGNGSAPVVLGIVVGHVALEGGGTVLFLRVEAVNHGNHTVGKAHALHTLVVVAGLAEANPVEPGFQQVLSLKLNAGIFLYNFVFHNHCTPFCVLYI